MAVLEVYLILWLMGIKIGLLGALVIEALTKLLNVIGVFNPGNVGTYEGGNMLIAKMFGLTGAVGLSVAVTRRLRAIFWAAVGGFCLLPPIQVQSPWQIRRERVRANVAKAEIRDGGQGASQAFTSVIFANTFRGVGEAGSPLMRVGDAPHPAPKHPLRTKGCWNSNHRVRGSRHKIRCAVRTAGHGASSLFC